MSQALMQKCVDDEEVQKYVHHFGVKLHGIYPKLLEVEDAENELWLSVFRAVRERYEPEKPLILFAKRAVFSRYGSMFKPQKNNARLLNEHAISDTDAPYNDPSYNIIDAEFTLDQIEKDLRKHAATSRQYLLAMRTLKLLRRGVTIKECWQTLWISQKYGEKLLYHIIRESSRKYRE